MFKKGQVVECVDADDIVGNELKKGCRYTVEEDEHLNSITLPSFSTYYARRFKLVESENKESDKGYELRLSSPYLLNYSRLYDEVMVGTTRVAKVTIKVAGREDQYILLVHRDILRKAKVQEGGQEYLDLLHLLGIDLGSMSRTLTIAEWATAYDLVKKLVKLPIRKELKADTIVSVKPLEV